MTVADPASGWQALLPYLGLAVTVAVQGFFSGSETGAYRLNRVRLHLAEQRGRRGAKALTRLLQDMPGLICVTLIGTNLALYASSTLATRLWESASGEPSVTAELLATLSLTPVLFVFAEVLPKNIYNVEADRLMYASAGPLSLVGRVFRSLGLVAMLKGISRLWAYLTRRRRGQRGETAADPFPARARLRSIIRDSAAEGMMTPYQNELVEKIMNLQNIHVGDAMVPAGRVLTLRQDAGREEFLEAVNGSHFSRLPVVDASGRDVVGVLRVYDALAALEPDGPLALGQFVTPAVVLPASMTVTQAIFALQRNRLPMAIVRDPRGQFVGIVTLKDLVEEIVGELEAW